MIIEFYMGLRKRLQDLKYDFKYYQWKFTGNLERERSADTLGRPEFIEITTRSFHYNSAPTYDPEGAHHLLSPDANDTALGQAVRDALSQTRLLTTAEYNRYRLGKEEKARIKELMKRYKIKSQRALLEGAACCTIHMGKDMIEIYPWAFSKSYYWDSGHGKITQDDYIFLPADCSDAELGQALRLGFSRCWPKTPWVKALMAEFDEAEKED